MRVCIESVSLTLLSFRDDIINRVFNCYTRPLKKAERYVSHSSVVFWNYITTVSSRWFMSTYSFINVCRCISLCLFVLRVFVVNTRKRTEVGLYVYEVFLNRRKGVEVFGNRQTACRGNAMSKPRKCDINRINESFSNMLTTAKECLGLDKDFNPFYTKTLLIRACFCIYTYV